MRQPVGRRRSGSPGDELLATLDGTTLMGEICPVVSIERMDAGRYRNHWHDLQQQASKLAR